MSRIRGMAVVLAMLLAFAATLAVYLYVKGVREEATTGGEMVTVIVSKQDIPVGTALDPLIEQGVFTTKSIPRDALVAGAVTDLSQLRGQTTAFPILANEQISVQRFQGRTEESGLGLREGFQAVTISVGVEQAVGGHVQRGDRVTIYGTFDVTIIQPDLPALLAGAERREVKVGQMTLTLVPEVRVLDVDSEDPGLITLELTPEDTERLVYAKEHGSLWLALLHPKDKGQRLGPINLNQIIFQ